MSESLTAMGVCVRTMAGEDPRTSTTIQQGVALLVKKPPTWDAAGRSVDLYYWFWGSWALRTLGGEPWDAWSKRLDVALLGKQHAGSTRHDAGSWDAVGPWCPEGGRVYATAVACLALQSEWRLQPE